MRKLGLLWAAMLMACASSAWAQTGPESVCEINVTVPRPGGGKQFEAARKKHNEFHRTEKDKYPILVWSITTGSSTGSYLTAGCGMTWKDMDGHDDFDKRDMADIEKTLLPAIGANHRSYYVLRKDLSLAPDPGTPTKMMTVVHYYVKPSALTEFTDAIKKINAAAVQSKYPVKPSRWYQLVSGGQGPHYVIVTDRASWADMQPPEQTMMDMLKQVYGSDDKTLQSLRDSVERTESELLEYRADLSYVPAK